MKLLLHACCGPCSLEPVRLLAEAGHDIVIFYSNSNIAPRDEYERRLSELRAFADSAGVRVVEGAYDPEAWEASAGALGDRLAVDYAARIDQARSVSELLDDANRQKRCRACYRQRLREAAAAAREGGFDTFSTTLSVSPYQFTDVIRQELERAGAAEGIEALFEDFRPYYDEATRRSREAGMYRQSYCGCRFSIAEGEATRAWLKRQRALKQAASARERAGEDARQAAERAEKARLKRAYADKQARKKAVLKALRAQGGA